MNLEIKIKNIDDEFTLKLSEHFIRYIYNQKLSSNYQAEYNIETKLSILDSVSENNRLKELTNLRQEIYGNNI